MTESRFAAHSLPSEPRKLRLDILTPRVRQVIELLVLGKSPSEIADQLGTKTSTVLNQIKTAYDRTHTHDRVALLRYFYDFAERLADQ